MEQIIEIIGIDGVRRRARKNEVLGPGERCHFPGMLSLMDAMSQVMADATASDPMVRDGYGSPAGHRPGYAFAGNNASLSNAADAAYVQRCERLNDAWRHRDIGADVESRFPNDRKTVDQQSADTAELAWEGKKRRLQNAWRQRG